MSITILTINLLDWMGCKRLTKWWYLQATLSIGTVKTAVKGLQNGGIYKVGEVDAQAKQAVKGSQNGGIYKTADHSRAESDAVKGLQNGGIYKTCPG